MKIVFIAGAGRSSTTLISHLLDSSERHGLRVIVGDASLELAVSKCNNHPNAQPTLFDVNDADLRKNLVSQADLVISLLPPDMHHLLVEECLKHGKHFLSASYVSAKVAAMEPEAREKGVVIISECGLDPGIDHMSAMEIINRLKSQVANLISFKSYTGGLVAPESNDNPWGYKISWNPRNVILAGQGTASYLWGGKYKHTPYSRIFTDIESLEVEQVGRFDGYANRDSVSYMKIYGLEGISGLLRGTLRQRGYCRAWNVFVTLGLTDDGIKIPGSGTMTYAELVESFLPVHVKGETLAHRVASLCGLPVDGEAMTLVSWTGIFEDTTIGIENATPAQILQKLLESKWILNPEDKDMVVMVHDFVYELNGETHKLTSSLVVKGEDSVHTAMAKTVGLPLAITALKLMDGSISLPGGLYLPVTKEIYEPVLHDLEKNGIVFQEKVS
ncbi:MAG: saccharopine dehydrogenase family protein [Bacteroidota bacterium]